MKAFKDATQSQVKPRSEWKRVVEIRRKRETRFFWDAGLAWKNFLLIDSSGLHINK